MSAHLAVRDVAFEYPGPLRAVDGVDLELRPGTLTCVLGPNGSGKSTLLKLLCGLERPLSGEVLLDGRPLARLRDRERARRIAVVPQALLAVPQLEVARFVLGARYSHLGFWKRAERADHELVAQALAQVDAADLARRSLDELSGGQRQRVLVARALAQEADHLLVDEPTSSLDLPHQLAVFELLARFACDGRAVLVVTHDLNLASQFSNDLVILDRGRVHARGAPAEVLRPEVLEGVYGPKLHYGDLPGPGTGRRPFVVPWSW